MNKIERAIRKACPDFEIRTLENIGEGDFCRAFLVNEFWVFRFAKHEEARKSLRRENCLLPQIAGKITLRVPEPRFSSLPSEPAEGTFVAYEFLPGKALTPARYLELDDASRTRCAGQVARFLNEMHALDCDSAEKCGAFRVDYKEKYSALLKNLREKLRARLEKSVFEFAANELVKFLDSVEKTPLQPVLLHGDLSPDHVLFDGDEITSIIDFGDMMIGDAAWDFTWIYEDYGLDFFERAISRYESVDRPAFVMRVRQFSIIESIQWISDCAARGESVPAEAVEHLRSFDKRN